MRKRPARNQLSDEPTFLNETFSSNGPGNYVPARLLALYRHPETQVDMAIVHCCQPQMIKNAARSTVLTESYHLHSERTNIEITDEDGRVSVQTKFVPMYHIIETTKFLDGVRVYLEDPRILEYWQPHDSSGHGILLTFRSQWHKEFLQHR